MSGQLGWYVPFVILSDIILHKHRASGFVKMIIIGTPGNRT